MRSTVVGAPLFAAVVSLLSASDPAAAADNLFRGGDAADAVVASRDDNPYLPGKQARIIGGWEAEEDRYPYSVSIQDANGHFCGGSLIAGDVVLTAAHCVVGGGTVIVVIGSDDVDVGEKIAARKFEVHPDYDAETDRNDYGLIFLREATSLDIPFVKINDDPAVPPAGATAYTVGWGDVDPDEDKQELADTLREVDVDVISNEDCAQAERDGVSYRDWVYDDMVCADTPNKDACQGDSGGPLVIKGADAESDVQVGIVSWGYGCAYLPGVYARTSYEYEWIEATVCENTLDPGSNPLCGTPAPTNLPTERPTTPPPTRRPTDKPTSDPTNKPTESPTKRPTKTPTTPPTISPSYSPSKNPTPSPSFSPTTAEPTRSPTMSPTSMPSSSAAPTDGPSSSPTVSARPTSRPTESPSISLSPTVSPSASPTASSRPTESPSASQSPSTGPTFVPTVSHQPTASVVPTASPTSRPSISPSTSLPPSSVPSAIPTSTPSGSPTTTASPTVSGRPTASASPSSLKKPTDAGRDGDVPASALLFTDLSVVAGKEEGEEEGARGGEKEAASSSPAGTGDGFVGAALLGGIVSARMMLA